MHAVASIIISGSAKCIFANNSFICSGLTRLQFCLHNSIQQLCHPGLCQDDRRVYTNIYVLTKTYSFDLDASARV